MSNDSTKKTLGVALGVCLVCSVLVSTAAVSLKPIQTENKKLDKLQNILIAGDIKAEDENINKLFKERVKPVIIELKSGKVVPESEYTDLLNPEKFDIKTMASDPEYGMDIPPKEDIAHIKRMPKYMTIYEVMENGEVSKIILPIYGKGLWSTLYGFIALDKDLKTVRGFTFYEHGETPGLGGEVDNPRWKQLWKGKIAYDDDLNVKIEVIKGKVDPASENAKYRIDGLSGSTLTTRGVNNLVRFWLSKNGYVPFLASLREGGANE